jgi:hypothetical protein
MLQLDTPSIFTGFAGRDQIDLPGIVFNPQATISYAANSTSTGGSLTVSDHAGSLSLVFVGDYASTQFATSGDGHGGTLVSVQQASDQSHLVAPPRG